jgi:putative aldouronate transport system permease protein
LWIPKKQLALARKHNRAHQTNEEENVLQTTNLRPTATPRAPKPGKAVGPHPRITTKLLFKQRSLIFMSFPFVVWLIIFAYIPLWGWIMAFQDFKPALGFFEQSWVGMKHFGNLFSDRIFLEALRNTIGMSLIMLAFGFTSPIVFALLLNEIGRKRFKLTAQTISYLPHFVSWVITASIVTTMLSNEGIINSTLMLLGIVDKPVGFMTSPKLFWVILAVAETWKEVGWNAIIYLSAIAGIDQQLYEAASVDGAGRWRRMFYITIPGIMPVIIILLILSIGGILNIGFERQRLLGNALVKSHSLSIDQYALEYGIGMFRYSYGTAIGIFRSVVSLILLFGANFFARKKLDTAVF